MRKLIQFVGIPGVGKSYLFKRIGLEGINYLEFGTEFKEWISKIDGYGKIIVPDAPKHYVREFIDKYLIKRQPAIFTSHIAHYDGKDFVYDAELERYTAVGGYVLVSADPSEILQRRLKDNGAGSKPREVWDADLISRHQQFSLDLVKRFSAELGVRMMRVENTPGLENENLERIRGFAREVLL